MDGLLDFDVRVLAECPELGEAGRGIGPEPFERFDRRDAGWA